MYRYKLSHNDWILDVRVATPYFEKGGLWLETPPLFWVSSEKHELTFFTMAHMGEP